MYLSGLIHRDHLFEVAMRWFHDNVEPRDAEFLTKVFVYESLICGPVGRDFMVDVLRQIHPDPLHLRRVYQKDEVREAIIDGLPVVTPAMQAHYDEFRRNPDEYFPSTPVDVILATGARERLHAMMRIKRIRRVAEKASRRVADRLAGTIWGTARSLAALRAQASGVTLEELISSPEQMAEEFAAAERVVSQAFRDRRTMLRPADMHIDDVIGFKFIGTSEELRTIERRICDHPSTTLVEREVHTGSYNAVNLLLDFQRPPAGRIVDRMRDRDWSFAAGRGIPPARLREGFGEYLESGETTFRAEVILTSPEELVESEFGRSIHEEHVLDQRTSAPYQGRIASNASYLIEYLLMVGLSPTVHIESLPVKMWGRYLPDNVSAGIWDLFGVAHDVVVWDSFLPKQEMVVLQTEEGR